MIPVLSLHRQHQHIWSLPKWLCIFLWLFLWFSSVIAFVVKSISLSRARSCHHHWFFFFFGSTFSSFSTSTIGFSFSITRFQPCCTTTSDETNFIGRMSRCSKQSSRRRWRRWTSTRRSFWRWNEIKIPKKRYSERQCRC